MAERGEYTDAPGQTQGREEEREQRRQAPRSRAYQ